ncbi:hypothetical protein PoB_000207900 [Plakobranchus ocellatus]|uniref:Galectin n=1 Tax=Plakobranchus ocellatus TaxID=259542 RepID=A0AAV3Y053_9GAST|nr:hypothetical protein PoB_000207900 [Plakobranchus ocellatus]
MANFERRRKLNIQSLAFLMWMLCHVIYGPSNCSYALQSSNWIKVEVTQVLCASDLAPLRSSPIGRLECAIACRKHHNCRTFMFTPLPTSSVGTCSWCPAFSTRATTFTTTEQPMEIWSPVSGRLLSPAFSINLAIPSLLTEGRILTVRGRVPSPPPLRFWFSLVLYNQDIVYQPHVVFDHGIYTETIIMGYRIGSVWHSHNIPQEMFPFRANEDFEIVVLVTTEGFITYINGRFMTTMNSKEVMDGEIGYIFFGNNDVGSVVEFKEAIF